MDTTSDKGLLVTPRDDAGRTIGTTYKASTAAVLVAAASTAPFFTLQSPVGNTMRLNRVVLSGLTLTAVAYLNISLAYYSVLPTDGTATALTILSMDGTSNPFGNTCSVYTAAPSAGTKIADIAARSFIAQATTAAAAGRPDVVDFDFRSYAHGPQAVGGTSGFGMYFTVAPATAVSMMLDVEYTVLN